MNQWHELVMEFDSGDPLDSEAGVTLYVDGVQTGGPGPGAWYNGSSACADATYYNGSIPPDNSPGIPGTCGPETNNECTPKLPGVQNAASCSPGGVCGGGYSCLVGDGTGNICTPGLSNCYCSLTPQCTTDLDCGSTTCITSGAMAGYCRLSCWNVYPFSGEAPLRLGTREFSEGGVPDYWAGGIDELAIFPRKLTQTEVTQLFNNYR
jgi:hypothetical protein